ncbi:MAG: hypothetical protein AMXMBFR84_07110 [Candidatus Hydrogenedentota bacterium]
MPPWLARGRALVKESVVVELAPMLQEEFAQFRDQVVSSHAREKVRAGLWHPCEAVYLAVQSFRDLLPMGLDTPNHHLLSVLDEITGSRIGGIWFESQEMKPTPEARLHYLLIYEPYRRQSYATHALQAFEARAHELGLDRVAFHVSGYNRAALALYAKLGYATLEVSMAKDLMPIPADVPAAR